MGDDGHLVVEGHGGNDGIAERKFALLAQVDGELSNVVSEGQHGGHCEESFQSSFFRVCEAMVAKHFDVADDGCTADVGLNELPQRFVLGLGGVDDVAVEEHQSSRLGKGRS